MSQVNEQVIEQVIEQNPEVSQDFQPIFEEIQGMDQTGAVNVLIQAAGQAQASGALSVRDSVMVAQAINLLQPGTI